MASLQHGAFEDEQNLVLILEFAARVRAIVYWALPAHAQISFQMLE